MSCLSPILQAYDLAQAYIKDTPEYSGTGRVSLHRGQWPPEPLPSGDDKGQLIISQPEAEHAGHDGAVKGE